MVCKKLDEGDNFNITSALKLVLFEYNNSLHSTILFKPIEIYYSTCEDLYKKVYFNTLNSFKHLNMDSSVFNFAEKVLLFNNFIIDKKKSNNKKYLINNKIKKNKSFYKICATICDNKENGLYEIIIEKNYKQYNLYKYDLCIVNSELLKKVDEDVWNNIYLD